MEADLMSNTLPKLVPFEEAWIHHHPGLRPIGYMLREDDVKTWIRFHSLPQSKRYAETDKERGILLNRQNVLATEVLGLAGCWLIQTHWVTPPGMVDVADELDPFRTTRERNLEFAFEFSIPEDDDQLWRVHAVKTDWVSGQFDDLLLAVADEKAGPTIWMSGENGSLFAPYDGGVDLFLHDVKAAKALAVKYADWLPTSESGL